MYLFPGLDLPDGFPKITKSPKDAQYDKTQYYGANLTFECDATGKDTEVRWFFRRVPIDKESNSVLKKDQKKLEYKLSNNGKVLKIINLGKVTMSWLECFVVNSVGMNTAGRLLLNSKPALSKVFQKLVGYLAVRCM